MAVFRVERTRDYTVMSNHHFGKLTQRKITLDTPKSICYNKNIQMYLLDCEVITWRETNTRK